eukprot:5465815-Pleurochrysis_carterae.AAC.1
MVAGGGVGARRRGGLGRQKSTKWAVFTESERERGILAGRPGRSTLGDAIRAGCLEKRPPKHALPARMPG